LHQLNEALAIADDRERIARDLHDTVIQRMFASGLSLQNIAASVPEPVRDRLLAVVDDLDTTIRELRTAVFRLKQRGDQAADVRNRLLEVIAEAGEPLGFTPRFQVDGVAAIVTAAVAEELVAVAREGLSNVARHAHATVVSVSLTITRQDVSITIEDDGSGLAVEHRVGNGLANLGTRAARLGGRFEAGAGPRGGTRLLWSVPLTASDPHPG
jgi:signal transduction histidine kinase